MRFPLEHFKFWCCCLMMVVGIYSFPVSSVLADRFSTGEAAPTIVTAPTEIKISLGNTANELKFFPDRVQLVAGKKYKLLLSNSSPQKHYFTAMEFASSSWTQKVDAGNVEIKGAIQELELRPSTNAAWVLVPMKPGNYKLRCTIPGHTEAGMTGTIAVAP
ncbi:plastocyanin/azurin family copper-binding protein [Chamaesiphon sp. VAR_48_metabat_135_sub]|uniref:plastocyanin/azurin family copper-binding protein n=1 Tax=Chamaesiphon sp. VAR_48_metabat_135_sub TaxID=2964699 RepID=UPI00286C0D63|nr:plastocyanin/azurin family copper-binding protein [Chamaesiphon sp. VAR_48_metabat_135_sub]